MRKTSASIYKVVFFLALGMSGKLAAQDLYVGNTALVRIDNSGSIRAGGNVTLAGSARIDGTGPLIMGGTALQALTGTGTSLEAVVLDNPAGLVLSGSKTINTSLSLQQGMIDTRADTLFLASGAAVSRVNGYVSGAMSKVIASGTNTSQTFEVGTASGYSPVRITFPVASNSDRFTVSSIDGDHPLITGSGIDPVRSVNKYWMVSNAGILPNHYSITLSYGAGDNDPGSNPSNYQCAAFNGTSWSPLIAPAAIPTNTLATFDDLSGSQSLQVGESASLKLHLFAFIEGLYIAPGIMTAALANSGIAGASTAQADSITVELHLASAPYSTALSIRSIVDTSGFCMLSLPGSVNGNSYFIVIRHRSSMETWSALPVVFSENTFYDFTSAAGKAWGSNQKAVAGNKYALFSGDVNQDGVVNNDDMLLMDNDAFNFLTGYLPTDITGDGNVTNDDMLPVDNNNFNFISLSKP